MANSILDDDTMYNLIHDQIFEFVMGKSVSKNTFKKINILTFMPVFKTKEDERYYTLEVEDKRIAFKLNQDSFKTLLKCGVVITEKHLKQLKEAKDLFALLHKLNVKIFNEYLHIHKGQKCTTRKGGLIYLNDLRKIDDLEDFLQSHPRFVMLEQILEILTQIKDLNSSQKEEFLQNYDFKNWEYENNEIFIYDKVETKYNNSMRFINSKKENRKPKSEIRLLAHTQIDCNEQEIEEQAVELFEGFSQNEAEFALIMILDYLNMVQESEFDNILDVKIIKSPEFHANTNFYQSLDEFLKKEEIFNIIFIRDSNEIFYYLSKVFRILRFKINFNFCLKNTDTELQVFVIENEQNKNLKTALFIGTSVEEIGILKFIKEEKFNKNALPFMANLYVEIDGAMALNSCFYQGRYTLKYKDEFIEIDRYIGHIFSFCEDYFSKYLRSDLKKIVVGYMGRELSEKYEYDGEEYEEKYDEKEYEEFKCYFDEKFPSYIDFYTNFCSSLFVHEKDDVLYIMFCKDKKIYTNSSLEYDFKYIDKVIRKYFPFCTQEFKFYSTSPYAFCGLKTSYIQEELQIEKLKINKNEFESENFISLESAKLAKNLYDNLKPFDGLNALKFYEEFKKIYLTPMQFLKEEDKEYTEFEIDISIHDESKRGYISFRFEKVFTTFLEDEYIAGSLNMVIKFRKTSESKFKSQSYSSLDNEGEFVKFAGLEEVEELEDLELSYQDHEIRNKKIFEFIEQNNAFKHFFYDENYKEFEVSFSSAHQDCDVVWIDNVFTLQENKQLSFLDKITSFFKK